MRQMKASSALSLMEAMGFVHGSRSLFHFYFENLLYYIYFVGVHAFHSTK